MANFYNPYLKKPDYGQGMNDMMNQLMMMYLIGMFPSKTTKTGTTPLPKPSAGQIAPSMGNTLMQNLPTATQGINPNMIAQLLQGFQGAGGFGGF